MLSFDTVKEAILYFLPEIMQKLKIIGYRIKPKILGEGYYGLTYDILNTNRVLKITGDRSGAIAASKLMSKNYKYIVKIFRVFIFAFSLVSVHL